MRHYEDSDWKNYIEGRMSNLENALMEEHLYSCDICMEKYLALMEAAALTEPSSGFADTVVKALVKPENLQKEDNKKLHYTVFLRYAAAASIAFVLWQTGVFGLVTGSILKIEEHSQKTKKLEAAYGKGFGDRIVDEVNSMFDYLSSKGDELLNDKK